MSAIERFLDSIGYPERAPEGAASFTLQVDGAQIMLEQTNGRLRLRYFLTDEVALLPLLAGFAAGRLMKEETVLAADEKGAFLWREIDSDSSPSSMQGFFEAFADSCDWWRERIEEMRGGKQEASAISEMMIRP